MSRCLFAACLISIAAPALGFQQQLPLLDGGSFFGSTYLIELRQGSPLSQSASQLRNGGFELAGGESVRMQRFYETNWVDVGVSFMTQLTDNMGVIFGMSTGERAQKYTIDPSLKLGLVMQMRPARNAVLSLRATKTFGGELNERSCTADYGDIGGVRQVNCRLAAAPIAPDESLKYLLRERPLYRSELSVNLKWMF